MPTRNLNRTGPYVRAIEITPSDATVYPASRGIYVGGTGNLRIELLDGSIATFGNIAAGVVHQLEVVRVFATGTTATGVRLLY